MGTNLMSLASSGGKFLKLYGDGKMVRPTARDYVQDGLVAMWDGIENAGWGQHDANATVWKDLVGIANIPASADWKDSSYDWDGTRKLSFRSNDIVSLINSGTFTVEYSYRSISNRENSAILAGYTYGTFGLWIFFSRNTLDNLRLGGSSNVLTSISDVKGFHTISFSASNGTGKFYFDGVHRLDIISGSVQISNPFFVGALSYATQWPAWNGDIFNIRMSNKVLTAAEIAANYAIDKARFNLPD